MAVLDRAALEESPLADLHTIARELGIDGFRRLRKAALIDAIVQTQTGEEPASEPAPEPDREPEAEAGAAAEPEAAEEDKPRSSRSLRSRSRSRSRTRRDADEGDEAEAEAKDDKEPRAAREPKAAREAVPAKQSREPKEAEPDKIADGTVELLGNGSGFLRVSPPDPSDDDVYISAAQVRRCELVSGDTVTGPVRPPRRSERYPSLVRIDTINGRPADEVSEGTPFDELPAAFPTQRFALGGDDPTLKAIEWLTPIGRGSRVTIVGPARAGKTEALRRLAAALAGTEGLDVSVVLAGVRPEEITEWRSGPVEPVTASTFASSPDAQAAAVERAVEMAKRIAARGGDAVVLIDSAGTLPPGAARRTLAAARDIVDGGSLTIVATADTPVGGETTVVALDERLTSTGRFPALDLAASGTLRPELQVGDAGAEAIAQARSNAV
jgi:transcription termination factor Rho